MSVDNLNDTPFEDWTEEMKSCYAKWLMSPVDPKVSECKLRGEIVRLHDQLKKAKSIVIQLLDDWDDEADRKWNWGRLLEVLGIKLYTAKEDRQAEKEPTDECCDHENAWTYEDAIDLFLKENPKVDHRVNIWNWNEWYKFAQWIFKKPLAKN